MFSPSQVRGFVPSRVGLVDVCVDQYWTGSHACTGCLWQTRGKTMLPCFLILMSSITSAVFTRFPPNSLFHLVLAYVHLYFIKICILVPPYVVQRKMYFFFSSRQLISPPTSTSPNSDSWSWTTSGDRIFLYPFCNGDGYKRAKIKPFSTRVHLEGVILSHGCCSGQTTSN